MIQAFPQKESSRLWGSITSLIAIPAFRIGWRIIITGISRLFRPLIWDIRGICGDEVEVIDAVLLPGVIGIIAMHIGREGYPLRGHVDSNVIHAALALEVSERHVALMERRGMTEEQAHYYLQKKSMDSGAKLVQTARLILDGGELE